MKLLFSATAASLLGLAFSAAPAAAQQTGPAQIEIARTGSTCPSGYSRGSTAGLTNSTKPNPDLCYADGSKPPYVMKKASLSDPCPAGLRAESSGSLWCTNKPEARGMAPEQWLAKGRFPKPSKAARCPATYRSSLDFTECYTSIDNPPAVRLSKGKPCGPDEVNEFDLWCTSRFDHLPYSEIESAAFGDYAKLLDLAAAEGRPYSTVPGNGQENKASPGIRAWYQAQGKLTAAAAAPAASGPSKGDHTSAAEDEARGMAAARGMTGSNAGQPAPAQCTSGSATGAAIGGAVGGDAGAKIGSMLGGLGKKKKKQAGC